MKLVNNVRLLFRVGFVDREKERASGLSQQLHQFEIRRGQFGPSINHNDDGSRFIERDARLPKNF